MLIEYDLTERHGRALLKLPDDQLRRQVLDRIISQNLNVNKTENYVEDTLNHIRNKEDIEYKQKIKSLINIRIYINTLKKAFKSIREYGVDAKYTEEEKEDHIVVSITIPK